MKQDDWALIRNMTSEWSKEDLFTLRKAITLKQVDVYWDQNGLYNLVYIEMLAKQFDYDWILQKIYNTMLIRVNDRMKIIHELHDGIVTLDDLEYMFKDQPLVYNEDVREGHIQPILYDVHKCLYKRRLQAKYTKLYDIIDTMIIMG